MFIHKLLVLLVFFILFKVHIINTWYPSDASVYSLEIVWLYIETLDCVQLFTTVIAPAVVRHKSSFFNLSAKSSVLWQTAGISQLILVLKDTQSCQKKQGQEETSERVTSHIHIMHTCAIKIHYF